MKKVLVMIAFMLSAMMANAQEIELNEQGAYERKEVFQIEGATATQLYDRAMIALTDWTGADGKSKAGIDYQNQETHTVIYKGTYYLGFKKAILGAGWNRYANFTLKVRCKDGKAQVTVTVAGITGIYNTNGTTRQLTMSEVLDVTNDSKGKKKERRQEFVSQIVTGADNLVAAMGEKLKSGNTDEDF